MLKQYDLVKVVSTQDKDVCSFIGGIGIIAEVHEKEEYPYEILFVGKKLNDASMAMGILLWKEEELEVV